MTDHTRARLIRQSLAGLLCAAALYVLACNEVAATHEVSLFTILTHLPGPLAELPVQQNLLRALAGLAAVAGSFFCLATMGNTLGLISLFGSRIALSARLTGAVLGVLLALAAAALGHYAADFGVATLLVTPLASVLVLLLWQSQRDPSAILVRSNASAPPPILLDLPAKSAESAKPLRPEPVPTVAAETTSNRPATFTARAPRAGTGNQDLAPLDFIGGAVPSVTRSSTNPAFVDHGLPPLEFTRSAAPAPAPAIVPRNPTPRLSTELPPLEFPVPGAPRPPTQVDGLTLETLDFSATPPTPRIAAQAPLADELARWSPRPSSTAAPPETSVAPSEPATPSRPRPSGPRSPSMATRSSAPERSPIDLPEDEPPGARAFTLDTVAPREQGPRRSLLDEEPDLLAQLGGLSQVQTPPAAPLAPLLPERTPGNLPQSPRAPTPPREPQRIRLADKGVFSIYKLVDEDQIIGYALTERGITVMTGSQEQVKQCLRERWPGRG